MQDAATSIPVLFWLIPLGTAVLGGLICWRGGRAYERVFGAFDRAFEWSTRNGKCEPGTIIWFGERGKIHSSGPDTDDTPEQRARAGQ